MVGNTKWGEYQMPPLSLYLNSIVYNFFMLNPIGINLIPFESPR